MNDNDKILTKPLIFFCEKHGWQLTSKKRDTKYIMNCKCILELDEHVPQHPTVGDFEKINVP